MGSISSRLLLFVVLRLVAMRPRFPGSGWTKRAWVGRTAAQVGAMLLWWTTAPSRSICGCLTAGCCGGDYTTSTGAVSTFMIGREDVTVEAGLRVLADHAHGRDGKLLGPLQLSPMEAVRLRKRPHRARRW